jgi:glycosyltransferase involved in cell wall biosynthesis
MRLFGSRQGANERAGNMQATRRAAVLASTALRDLRYPLPKLHAVEQQQTVPTVYFCAPDWSEPAGGIRVAYRHVDILNQAGIRAAVLHRRDGFRCTWFENDTRVVGSRDTVIGPEDLVVVSELAVSLVRNLEARHRFVVFNQGPHLTWGRVSEEALDFCMNHPGLAAIVVVSGHSLEMMRYAAPSANVLRLHNSIDPHRFFPGPPRPRPVISYMPRRGLEEASQVLGILRGRGVTRGWDVRPLEGLTEDQVADQLRLTTIFLSFAYQEGFGLPAAEAMACGAYVVGFHGFGGREYFRPEFSHPVDPGDVLGLARAAEEAMDHEAGERGWCQSRGAAAAQFIAAKYSPDHERRDVVETYSALVRGQA